MLICVLIVQIFARQKLSGGWIPKLCPKKRTDQKVQTPVLRTQKRCEPKDVDTRKVRFENRAVEVV